MRRFCQLNFVVLAIAASLISVSCRRSSSSQDETPDTSTYRPEATPGTDFEQKLKIIRDGGFRYVWVFKRLDGKEFTHDDTEILHRNAPKVVDWVGTDDQKTFIAGSNVGIDPDNAPELKKHYKIEDLSVARP